MIRDDQPDAGDGQAGRSGVAERSVVLLKLGNAGGGKGPQFKAGAESGDAQEIGVTLRNSGNVQELQKAPHAEAKERPGIQSGERMSAQVAALAVAWRTTVQEYNRDSPILLLLDRLRATFRGRRHASCPRAGCGRSACPVR